MTYTNDEIPTYRPDYDFNELLTMHSLLLEELHRVLRSMPKADATPEEIQDWATAIASEWVSKKQLPDHLLGGWSSFIWGYVDPWLKPIRQSVVDAEAAAERSGAALVEETKTLLQDSIEAVRTDVQKLQTIVDAIEDKVKSAIDGVINNRVKAAETAFAGFFERVTEDIQDDLLRVVELFAIARELRNAKILMVKERIDWVGRAFAFLLNKPEVTAVTALFHDLVEKEDKNKLEEDFKTLFSLLMKDLNPMIAAFIWIVESIIQEKLVMPNDLGIGFTPGRVYDFINDEKLEPGENGELSERDFRIEIVSVLDRYFHGEFEVPSIPSISVNDPKLPRTMPRSTHAVDGKLAIQSVTDLIRVLLQTSIGVVFRAPHLPSVMAPKMSLFQPTPDPKRNQHDVAAKNASATLSRSLSIPVKALIGLLMRGAWEINTHNDALVEMISTTVSQAVGSLFESITHTLFSLVEIRELYENPVDENGKLMGRCLMSWKTQAVWQSQDNKKTFQAVVIKKGILNDSTAEDEFVKGIQKLETYAKKNFPKSPVSVLELLLKDYGTYIELSQVCHEPDLANKATELVQVHLENDGKTVVANYKDPDDALPIVLRVYASGYHAIMVHSSDGAYTAELPAVQKDVVHVLGGSGLHGSCPPSS